MTQTEIDNLKTQLLSAMEHRVVAEREWRDAVAIGVKLVGVDRNKLLKQAGGNLRQAEKALAELRKATKFFGPLNMRALFNG